MTSAALLTEGSWTARWSNHVIHLRERDGQWRATVWLWPQGARLALRQKLDEFEGFANAQVATAWACEVLVSYGASVLLDGQKHDLADFLTFAPAPEDVT
jgi:hypothetical protein